MKRQILPEQPYDALLWQKSRLYRRSRRLFLSIGGEFHPTLISSARSLGSAALISSVIEYSPVAAEVQWSASDRVQRKDFKHRESVHAWITGVYHEQNHRYLWHFLTKKRYFCPPKRTEAYRFLNLTESLVIVLDMALGDELDARLAERLYRERGIYNGGSAWMRAVRAKSLRRYGNGLQVCLAATYLRLEGLHPEDLPAQVHAAFSFLGDAELVDRAIGRAMKIEPLFVELTNPIWQKKHVDKVIRAFGAPRGQSALALPKRDPKQVSLIYGLGEEWLSTFNLTP